jgi:hypothetical protein
VITLPLADRLANIQREDIKSCLGHEIRSYPSRVVLIDPLPHHLDAFGRFVLASPLDRVDIYVGAEYKQLLVLNEDDEVLHWQAIPDGRVSILPGAAESFRVYVDGFLALLACFGECDPFYPKGIRIRSQAEEVELFSAHRLVETLRVTQSPCRDLTLVASSKRLLEIVRLNGRPFDCTKPALAEAIADVSATFELDAVNFGRIHLGQRKPATVRPFQESLSDRAAWLLSLPFPSPDEPACTITTAATSSVPQWLRALRTRTWSMTYAPHLRALAVELDKGRLR